jgi:NADH-ubiquinone oxidoreductase chain 6
MYNLYITNEIITNSLNHNFLPIFSLISILCGILIITSKNPIVSILFLIGLFITIASYLMMLGINFIGLSYLLVYVGAVSILFIFILMLINIRISELVDNSSNNIPLAILIGIFFNLSLGKLFVNQITLINFSEIFFLNYEKVFYTQSNTIYTNLEYILNNFINNELSFVTSYA